MDEGRRKYEEQSLLGRERNGSLSGSEASYALASEVEMDVSDC